MGQKCSKCQKLLTLSGIPGFPEDFSNPDFPDMCNGCVISKRIMDYINNKIILVPLENFEVTIDFPTNLKKLL